MYFIFGAIAGYIMIDAYIERHGLGFKAIGLFILTLGLLSLGKVI